MPFMKSVVFGSILNTQIRLHGRLMAEPPKEARLKTSHNYFFVKKNQGQGQNHLYLPAQFNSMYEFPCDAKLHVEHYRKMLPCGGGLFSTFTGESRPRSPGANNPNWDVSMTGFGHLFASFNKGFQHINKLKSELGLGE